jgi:hypothetical protein
MVILDNLGIHTPKGSRLLRGLLAELGEDLVLVYTPTYDPDAKGSPRNCADKWDGDQAAAGRTV